MTTETIDRLFLELSQFTKARTAKELALETEVERLRQLHEREMDNHYKSAARAVEEQRAEVKRLTAVVESIHAASDGVVPGCPACRGREEVSE